MTNIIKIGTTEENLTALELLPVPVANPTNYDFHEGSMRRKSASGREQWVGFPWADLYWTVIEQVQRDQLRSFCQGESAEVLVQLPKNSGEVGTYLGLMIWPDDDPTPEFSKIYKLRIKFDNLVPVVSG